MFVLLQRTEPGGDGGKSRTFPAGRRSASAPWSPTAISRVPLCSRLVSGLRSRPGGLVPTPSQALPSGFSRNARFATVAGAAPVSHRLPNYPLGRVADGHLERCDL